MNYIYLHIVSLMISDCNRKVLRLRMGSCCQVLAEVTTLQALQEITIRGLEIDMADMEGRFLSVSNLCPRQVQAILTAKE